MKKLLPVLFPILILFILSCENKSADQNELTFKEKKDVVITGRIFPFEEGKTSLKFAVDRIGAEQEAMVTDIDEQGYFELSFKTAIPTDFWVSYNSNFSLVAFPGDSLNIRWDGTKSGRPAILETVKVYSKHSDINVGVINYQKEYFSSKNYSTLFHENEEAYKKLNSKEYRLFVDSLHRENLTQLKKVFPKTDESDPALNWAKLRILETYFHNLAFYPMKHANAKGIKMREVELDDDFYSFWDSLPKINQNNMSSAHAISGMSNKYLFNRVGQSVFKEIDKLKKTKDSTKLNDEIFSKLYVEEITDNAPDEFWKQVLLSEFLHSKLDAFQFTVYENNQKQIDDNLQLTFLKEPVNTKYKKLKNESENPVNFSRLNEFEEDDVIASISKKFKNKTVYIDIWATWCGPCRSEFKYSNELKDQLKNEEVVFVYVCAESDKEAWKTATKHFNLDGEHYFLENDQLRVLKEKYEVSGYPTYMIIKNNGELMRNVQFRPSNEKTVEFLKQISNTDLI
ncbi:TlpA family protein disulfide reductase [Marivirga arenosa]|uniref:TlpA family protein disulfide reductase n=1 Tax=Marivirga arenosa TaxID=3059076 RepID=A0AA51R9C9_9BACT|nr:TlpA family protein disulfide reductase [Marivirga sp. ABR2-2]WMN07506.1 TlpA family protein disulfide reductase [Marivirga sp. ABR2-2]